MHWRRKWQPTAVFLPGESQGWGSLVGCRLWGCTGSDMTEATWRQQQQTTLLIKLILEATARLSFQVIKTELTQFSLHKKLDLHCFADFPL